MTRREEREETFLLLFESEFDPSRDAGEIYDTAKEAREVEDSEYIRTVLGGVLEKLGVEAFGNPGDKFDPNLHNAVFHEEDDSDREDEITDVFQKGYKKGNRIIRFAMVKTVN